MVEVETVFKNTVKNGEVKIGEKEVKQVVKNGKAKMVIIANNCPYSEEIQRLAKKKDTPVYNYKANSVDLGYSCGKAYAVSSFAVLKDGGTNILRLVK